MLPPLREIGELVIFSFYIAHIRKKLHLGPRPPLCDNLKIVLVCYHYSDFLASTYTGNIRICDFQFLCSSHKEKTLFGPPDPSIWKFKYLFACWYRQSVLNIFTKFHSSIYSRNRRISYFNFNIAHIKKTMVLGPPPQWVWI